MITTLFLLLPGCPAPDPFMIDRLPDCAQQPGRLPGRVSVDYHSLSDSLENINRLNEVEYASARHSH